MKLHYLDQTKEIDIYLDKEIRFIMEYSKEIVRNRDGFDPQKHALKLFYRGQILDNSKKLGNYVKTNDTVQIFKLVKPSVT